MRNHPPYVWVRAFKDGTIRARITGQGAPDYFFLADGFSLLVDAKDCQIPPWRSGLLKPHQAKAFDDFERQGGHAAVFMRDWERRRWVLPWPVLRPLWYEARAFTDFHDVGFRWEGDPPFDFLTPWLRWLS